jgi:ribokinase
MHMLVSGLINIETTLRVDGFPLAYEPVRYPFFGINSTVSGVGYNIAKALTFLGEPVTFLSLIGQDAAGWLVRDALAADGINDAYVRADMPATAQSLIIYDPNGRRQIHTDLKDIQERVFPQALFDKALSGAALAVLCNVNYNRPFLAQARDAGVPIATDVHTIGDLNDPYNSDFMAAADILFLSDEALPADPQYVIRQLQARYNNSIIVIGLGAEGALLAVRGDSRLRRVNAVQTRPVVNSIGAGDALFSSFLHAYRQDGDPFLALRQAAVFASYKIGATGAAEGFLSAEELSQLAETVYARD